MNDNIQERYGKGYIRNDQLQKYVKLGVVDATEYEGLTGEPYTGGFAYPYIKPAIDTSKMKFFNYFAASRDNETDYNAESLFTDEDLQNIDTSNGVFFNYMFYFRRNTTDFPQIETSNGVSFEGMYKGCQSVENLPPMDTSNGVNFYGMFANCIKLTHAPEGLNTANGTNLGQLFRNTPSLQAIPEDLDTSKNTNFEQFITGKGTMKRIPAFDTSKGVNFNRFLKSTAIKCNGDNKEGTLTFDVSNGENFKEAFDDMDNVNEIVFTNENGTGKGINFELMFNSCDNLETVSGLNFTNSENNLTTFSGCENLKDVQLVDGTYIHRSINLHSCMALEKVIVEKIIRDYLAETPKDEEAILYLNYDLILGLYEGTDAGDSSSSTNGEYVKGLITFKDEALNNLMKNKPKWKFYLKKIRDSRYNRDITPEA